MMLDAALLEVQALLHLGTLQHPNIVELLAYGWDEDVLPYLVLEYAGLGTLDSFLAATSQSWSEKVRIVVGIASALELLHACDIIHGDVKLENILVFEDSQHEYQVKLADFGFCCSENLGQRQFRGTRLVNAPEIRAQFDSTSTNEHIEYSKADVYSFGIVIWEICNDGRHYYTASSINDQPDHDDTDFALAFLAQLDDKEMDITPYALKFISSLALPTELLDRLSTTLKLALARDPQTRADIRHIRMELDPVDK
jgi:serine/threonine protein kinase